LVGANGINESGPDSSVNEVLKISVVICAYTEQRWDQTLAAVRSVMCQLPRPAQIVLVVDHNAELAAKVRCELPEITVIESTGPPGLSGARNTGLKAASEPITAFLDDDAEAAPGWLSSLAEPYLNPNVVATGGSVHPRWPVSRPSWLPRTFDWVFGCSYMGLPSSLDVVRNPIGANMSMRTRQAIEIGGFNDVVGRVGTRPTGCEETELSIRLAAGWQQSVILYVPNAAVSHNIARERLSRRYFMSRCWHEGLSKAVVVNLVGTSAGLNRERRQIAVVIPVSILHDVRRFVTGDVYALVRVFMTFTGLITTMTGYLVGRLLLMVRRRSPEAVLSIEAQSQATFVNAAENE
jgi:glucosyl-dolichyl phosphate glucuronosyltransferase